MAPPWAAPTPPLPPSQCRCLTHGGGGERSPDRPPPPLCPQPSRPTPPPAAGVVHLPCEGGSQRPVVFQSAFSMDDGGQRRVSSSIASEGHIPRPAPVALPAALRMPLSARESREERAPPPKAPLSARGNGEGDGFGATVEERRGKLEALRAAVTALEAETGRKKRGGSAGGGAPPMQPVPADAGGRGGEVGRKVAALTARGGLPGRPQVPRLQLSSIRPSIRPTRMAGAAPPQPGKTLQQQTQQEQGGGRAGRLG